MELVDYNAENLKKKDRKTLQELTDLKKTLFSKENMENYIHEKVDSSSGDTIEGLTREIIEPYNSYLKEMIDCYICSFIIDTVEGYDDKKRKKKRKDVK